MTQPRALSIWLLALLISAPADAFNHGEALSLNRPIGDIQWRNEVEWRFRDTSQTYQHYDTGLKIDLPFLDDTALGDGWSFQAHYRATYQKSSGDWSLERRPYIQLNKVFHTDEVGDLPALSWELRTRQEYRMRSRNRHSMRNRQRVQLTSEHEWQGAYPFISNELFYDFDTQSYHLNRLTIGLKLPETEFFKPSLAYRLETQRQSGQWLPTDKPVSRLMLTLSF